MQPQIFLSYSWKNKAIADKIDNDWQDVGLTLLRDVRDMTFKQNIKDFMKRVHKSDFVLLLISKDYLESKNCMYEALEMFQNEDFKRKILPILTDDAQINEALARLSYMDHWEGKRQELSDNIRRFANPPASVIHELQHFEKIRDSIDAFASEVQSLLCAFWPQVQKENYSSIFTHIGYSKNDSVVLKACGQILTLATEEDQELALEELKAAYQDSPYVFFTESTIAYRVKKYKKAKMILERLLVLYPNYYVGHNNLAYLLNAHFEDFAGAREHYQQAISINPDYALAHASLAMILDEHYQDYTGARRHYEHALTLDPDHSDIHHNLGILLSTHLGDATKARHHLERALELNPTAANAHYSLGLLLARDFNELEASRRHCEEAIRLDPSHVGAHINLGIILDNNLYKEYDRARYYLERGIALGPTETEGYYNLALLLTEQFADFASARHLLETILQLDPTHADAHAELADVLYEHFTEPDNAKWHFEQALALEPGQVDIRGRYGLLLLEKFEDHVAARHEFEQALALDPNRAELCLALGAILLKHFDDTEGARKYFERSLAIKFDNAEAHYNLALLAHINQNLVDAQAYYQRAYELDSEIRTPENNEFFGLAQ
jgi:Tfp pilus assembly protein PilF